MLVRRRAIIYTSLAAFFLLAVLALICSTQALQVSG